jgi:hypothetical protein
MATGILQTPTNLTLEQLKQELYQNLRYRLGDGIIDLELDDEHFQSAYVYAIKIYRQRAQGATQETYTLLTLNKDVDTYTLPSEYINVRNVFRRTIGLETGPGSTAFDPFSSAILNTYLLNYNFSGGLATYHLYASYVELAGKMFGQHIIYTFNPVTKVLRIVRDPKATGERVLIWADMQRPEEELLQDPYSGVWIGDYILASLKLTIGEAREKFGSVPGPQGSGQLNGTAMKNEGKEMQKELLEDLKRYVDGSQPITFVIG